MLEMCRYSTCFQISINTGIPTCSWCFKRVAVPDGEDAEDFLCFDCNLTHHQWRAAAEAHAKAWRRFAIDRGDEAQESYEWQAYGVMFDDFLHEEDSEEEDMSDLDLNEVRPGALSSDEEDEEDTEVIDIQSM